MWKFKTSLFCSIAFLLCNSLPAQSWSVFPVKDMVEAKPGKSVTHVFVVDNMGESTTNRFDVSLSDWDYGKDGNPRSSPPGTRTESLYQHATYSPAQFSLLPGERKLVRLTVDVPANLAPGDYQVGLNIQQRGIVRKMDASGNKVGLNVLVVFAYAPRLVVRIPGASAKQLEVTGLTVDQPAEGPPVFKVDVKNDSDLYAEAFVSYEVKDAKGEVVSKSAEPLMATILRNGTRLVSVNGDKLLPPAQYDLSITVDSGKAFPLQQAQTHFEITEKKAAAPKPDDKPAAASAAAKPAAATKAADAKAAPAAKPADTKLAPKPAAAKAVAKPAAKK